jgi:hypothetical protein
MWGGGGGVLFFGAHNIKIAMFEQLAKTNTPHEFGKSILPYFKQLLMEDHESVRHL